MSSVRKSIEERLRESESRAAKEAASARPAPPRAPVRGEPRVPGARRPDETGMLRMVPLGSVDAPVVDVNATEFFRVPSPPVTRGRPTDLPAPVPRPAVGTERRAEVVGLRPAAVATLPPAEHRGAADAPREGGRIQTARVMAFLAFVFLLMSLAALAAAAVLVGIPGLRAEKVPAIVVPTAPVLVDERAGDTGGDEVVEVVPPVQQVRTGGGAASGTGGKGRAESKKTPTFETVKAAFSGASVPTVVELTCPGMARQRVALQGGAVVVSGVPVGVECQMHVKGLVATPAPVQAGHDYACTISGTTTSCR